MSEIAGQFQQQTKYLLGVDGVEESIVYMSVVGVPA